MRGLGYKPDPVGVRTSYRHVALRAMAAGVTIPTTKMLFDHAPSVMDQNGFGACTGHAVAVGISVAFNAADAPLGFVPSPDGIYRLGRAVDRHPDAHGALPSLTDDGAMPSQVFRGIREWGVRPMGLSPADGRFSDVDDASVNREPTLTELEQDARHLVLGDYDVRPTSIGVALALASNHPVCCAIAGGSNAFQSYSGGTMGPLNAPLDHYVVLLGYDTLANGHRIFFGQNSWGDSWGDRGYFTIDEACLAQLGDLVAIVPKSGEAS